MAGQQVAVAPAAAPKALPKIISAVESRVGEIALSLPKDAPSERFVQTFKSACRRDPKILKCTEHSVLDAVMRAAADGLMLDGREAALVVRSAYIGKDDNGKKVYGPIAVYTPMFMGMMKRARNSGEIAAFQGASLVYEKEIAINQDGKPAHPAYDGGLRFRFIKGDDERIFHDPLNFEDAGKVVGVYSIVRMKDGSLSREFMNARQIDAVRRRAVKKNDKGEEYGENPVWVSDFEEMAKKTVLRRHCKKLPMDSDLARVFDNLDRANGYEPTDAEIIDETPPDPEARSTKTRGGASAKLREAEADKKKAAASAEPDHNPDTGEIVDAEHEPIPDDGEEPWFG